MKIKLLIPFFFLAYSCNRKPSTFSEKKYNTLHETNLAIKKCMPDDTILVNEIAIKYISFNSSFDVKITIGNEATFLGYGFNCTAPAGLIPVVFAAGKNSVCLIRGDGQHYREFIVCYKKGDVLFQSNYETALTADMLNNNIAFRNYNSTDSVYVENFKSKKRKIFVLPNKLKYESIIFSALSKTKLFLKFANQKEINFPLVLQ